MNFLPVIFYMSCIDNSFFLFQIRNKKQHLHTHHQMRTRKMEIQLQKFLETGHHLFPSSRSQSGPVALLQTPSVACAPSCCRSETWVWATTRTRPSSSSTAAGRVPTFAPTTTSPWPTCWWAGCSLNQHLGSCGTTRPAAGPPTTRTWPSSTTRTAGTRWRSCRPRGAAVSARHGRLRGGSVWWFVRTGDSEGTSFLAGSLVKSEF